MELKPDEFYRLTPAEFNALVDGWLWRYRHNEEHAAKWVCVLINATGKLKTKVTPQEMLGRPLQPLLPQPKG